MFFNDSFTQKLTAALVLVACALPVTAKAGGSDIGNGGYGDPTNPNVVTYPMMPIQKWCSQAKGMLDEALSYSSLFDTHLMRRKALVESIQQILRAYQGGSVPMQPLTYTLLARTLEMNMVFPSRETAPIGGWGDRGDETAYIVLFHMVDAAQRVNTLFDTARYLPFYEHYTKCPGGQCTKLPAFDFGPFYTSYVQGTRLVLAEFFAPAYPDPQYKDRGNVLSAMSHDMWELKAMLKIIDWVLVDVRSDVFSRALECLTGRLELTRQRLHAYLADSSKSPFNAVTMRRYVEQSLAGILTELDSFVYQDGQGKCAAKK